MCISATSWTVRRCWRSTRCCGRKLQERGLYSDALMRRIAKEGTIAHIAEIPEDLRRVFVSCPRRQPGISYPGCRPLSSARTDNAVSKTVNFPHSATREEVAEVYMLAYKTGLQGRHHLPGRQPRTSQVLNIGKVKKEGEGKEPQTAASALGASCPRPAPGPWRMGLTERMKIGCGNLYVTVNYDEKGICEVFTNTGKAGGCPSPRAKQRPALPAWRCAVASAWRKCMTSSRASAVRPQSASRA